MKFVVVLPLLAAVAFGALRADRVALAAKVNAMQSSWVADADNHVAQLPSEVSRHMLGTDMKKRVSLGRRTFTEEQLTAAPKEFDAREQWPQCETMKDIRDQATCGSCWAFGSTESMSDRECVKNGKIVRLSTEDMNSCNTGCGGCNGGQDGCAWLYWKSKGLVTDDCRPYSIPSCDHHVPNSTNPCGDTWPTPRCNRTCLTSDRVWKDDKHFGAKVYSVYGEAEMMAELQENGPFEVALDVYEDFMTYKSGVYRHVTGSYEGGHAVKLIGWGVDAKSGDKYWLIANSWNPHWGENGYFRILKGVNECSIENQGNAGIPK